MFEILLRDFVDRRDELQRPVELLSHLWPQTFEKVEIMIFIVKDVPYKVCAHSYVEYSLCAVKLAN